MNDNKDLLGILNSIDRRLSIIEVDLRHHIKRSDKHERWLMVLLIGAAVSAGAGLKYALPFVSKFII